MMPLELASLIQGPSLLANGILPVLESLVVALPVDEELLAVVGGPASLVELGRHLGDEVAVQPQRHVADAAAIVQLVEVGRIHLLPLHRQAKGVIHRLLLDHGHVLQLEVGYAVVHRIRRHRRRRRVVEQVPDDADVVHPDSAAGILRPELELHDQGLLQLWRWRLRRRRRDGAFVDGELQRVGAKDHLDGVDDDGHDEHGHRGGHRVTRRVQPPEL